MTTDKEMINCKSIEASVDTVGEWDGDEQTACDNINRIRCALYKASPDTITEADLAQLFGMAWDTWGSDENLLSITDDQIRDYVQRVV